jgi:hypothetical protein
LSRIPLLPLALALLSCGPSPQRKADLARRSVRSWTATLRKTGDALEQGRVPRLYARQVVDAAREHRTEESTSAEWSAVPAGERGDLDRAIQQLAAAVGDPEADAPQ